MNNIHGRNKLDTETFEVPKYFHRKVVWMRLFAALLLVLISPILFMLLLAVRLTSPGPALFRQKRLGLDGKEFYLLKIRTMYRNAEMVSGPMLCLPGDSRITPIGRLLRHLHLDELPQLLNVARGEMCMVGPRPERPEIIARNRLRERVPGFDLRTKVRPGVTGLAQVNLPPDIDATTVIPKVQLDLEYIDSVTAGLDARLLLCTALRMFGIRHGRAVRWLGLNRPVSTDRKQVREEGGLTSTSRNSHSLASHGDYYITAGTGFALASCYSNCSQSKLLDASDMPADSRDAGVEYATLSAGPIAVPTHKPR